MHFLKAPLLAVPAVYACGDNSYRCKNPDKSIQDTYKVTMEICNGRCSHWAEDYCDPFGDNIQKFKEKCENQGENWYWVEC
ncbi:Ff.00g054990.m01.CDS01 [Fusarium sp. VM40]|nr:Ff.00g054990.m01.CDS01 [Fusarium sp. VM40]